MRAVIVGGGIGGLATAVALRKAGLETLVLERAASIREVGAGLSIWSNGVNALRELGVACSVLRAASVVDQTRSLTPAGDLITVTELAEISREAAAPSVCVHRGALQRILLEQLPPESVRCGAGCVGSEDSTVVLETGERIESDVLIGADGIYSVIRAQLHGKKKPRYSGYTCWRGIGPNEAFLEDRTALLAVGAGVQFGVWPCGDGKVYWFATKNAPQGTSGSKSALLELCRGWGFPIPRVIESTPGDSIIQNDIFDRPPLSRWGHGRVTLLGDAAHACTPNLGQGACQALEDAVTLAHSLRTVHPPEAALRSYERARIRRTTAVIRASRGAGRVFQLDQPMLEWLRNWFFRTSVARHLGMRSLRGLLAYRVPSLSGTSE